LNALQRDSRQSFNALAKLTGTSTPTVIDRVRRLEDQGILRGYTVIIDRKKLGWDLTSIIRVTCPQDQYQKVHRLSQDMSEILECHHVTGEDSFFIKVIARDIEHLETIISRFSGLGRSISTIVLSSSIEGKGLSIK
ncbi:Lrp/AsnC family transcriptional regulator, partial [Curvivirga aplysinae]|uniref:Lrp/AsnC family transcriptional regulator n=1 Tax=Curvivirga aplysinae TaxID=2529852 RepID=UPI0012BB6BB6